MQAHAQNLECIGDSDTDYSLNTKYIQKNKKAMWFGGIQIKKNYVSYHLMPVYTNPELLANVSPQLKKRMQGKSCFNFATLYVDLLKELAMLTEASYKSFQSQGIFSARSA
jgi:hypothetical protein